MTIRHPVLERKPLLCQHAECESEPQVWFRGVWVCMDHAEQDGLGKMTATFYVGDAIEVMALVDEQAEDEGLWFLARTAPEAYLQQELRRLHALIEATFR